MPGTGLRKDKINGRNPEKQENRTQSIYSNNVSRLCYKAEPGACHIICRRLPAFIGNGIKCHYCRRRPPRP